MVRQTLAARGHLHPDLKAKETGPGKIWEETLEIGNSRSGSPLSNRGTVRTGVVDTCNSKEVCMCVCVFLRMEPMALCTLVLHFKTELHMQPQELDSLSLFFFPDRVSCSSRYLKPTI